jgi:phosphate transport system substrate-binding protein
MRLILTSLAAIGAISLVLAVGCDKKSADEGTGTSGAQAASTGSQPITVDDKLPSYSKVAGVAGNLSSIGSDSLNNLMAHWVEAFRSQYPSVNIQVEGKGSSTAPPALIEGTAQLGPMSRDMTSLEVDQFKKKFGYEPTRIAVSLDTVAVFVHRDNPINALSLPQLDGIYSKTFASGNSDIKTWGEAGVAGTLAARPISLYGRNSASGTYGFFKEVALFKGDYKDTVKEQPGSSAVVQGVNSDNFGIGYSGIGYLTSGVKALSISKEASGQPYAPNYENALSGNYPLSRYLYIFVNKDPKSGLTPVVKEFLKFVLSKEGQEVVVKDGYLPLNSQMSADETKKL